MDRWLLTAGAGGLLLGLAFSQVRFHVEKNVSVRKLEIGVGIAVLVHGRTVA